jgi:hypothetical protein
MKDLIPQEWMDKGVWLSAYCVHGIRDCPDHIRQAANWIHLHWLQVRVIAFFGKFKYSPMKPKISFKPSGGVSVDESELRSTKESQGVHLFFMTHSGTTEDPSNTGLRYANIGTAVSMVAAFCGRNTVFELLCDRDISPNSNMRIAFTGPMETPWSLSQPDLTPTRFAQIHEAEEIIAKLPEARRNRVLLSLRWFRMTFPEMGTDAFLKSWIAMETLGMHDTNIRPLNDMLASAYGITRQQAAERFLLGRLYGLRGRIVHDGQLLKDNGWLKRYMENLFCDLLFEFLGLSCEFRTGTFPSDHKAELSKFF